MALDCEQWRRLAEVVTLVEYLLASYPLLIKEAWPRMWAWYKTSTNLLLIIDTRTVILTIYIPQNP